MTVNQTISCTESLRGRITAASRSGVGPSFTQRPPHRSNRVVRKASHSARDTVRWKWRWPDGAPRVPDDIELAVGADPADAHGLPGVVCERHRHRRRPSGAAKLWSASASEHRGRRSRPGLLHGARPQMHARDTPLPSDRTRSCRGPCGGAVPRRSAGSPRSRPTESSSTRRSRRRSPSRPSSPARSRRC